MGYFANKQYKHNFGYGNVKELKMLFYSRTIETINKTEDWALVQNAALAFRDKVLLLLFRLGLG